LQQYRPTSDVWQLYSITPMARPLQLGDEVRDTMGKARESPEKHRFGVLVEQTEQWKI
jgi:hypothetical protein